MTLEDHECLVPENSAVLDVAPRLPRVPRRRVLFFIGVLVHGQLCQCHGRQIDFGQFEAALRKWLVCQRVRADRVRFEKHEMLKKY